MINSITNSVVSVRETLAHDYACIQENKTDLIKCGLTNKIFNNNNIVAKVAQVAARCLLSVAHHAVRLVSSGYSEKYEELRNKKESVLYVQERQAKAEQERQAKAKAQENWKVGITKAKKKIETKAKALKNWKVSIANAEKKIEAKANLKNKQETFFRGMKREQNRAEISSFTKNLLKKVEIDAKADAYTEYEKKLRDHQPRIVREELTKLLESIRGDQDIIRSLGSGFYGFFGSGTNSTENQELKKIRDSKDESMQSIANDFNTVKALLEKAYSQVKGGKMPEYLRSSLDSLGKSVDTMLKCSRVSIKQQDKVEHNEGFLKRAAKVTACQVVTALASAGSVVALTSLGMLYLNPNFSQGKFNITGMFTNVTNS